MLDAELFHSKTQVNLLYSNIRVYLEADLGPNEGVKVTVTNGQSLKKGVLKLNKAKRLISHVSKVQMLKCLGNIGHKFLE